MSTAQLLVVVVGPSEVPAERFQSAVGEVSRRLGLTPSSWTYDATSATMVNDGPTGTISDGPWSGTTFNTTTATGSRRVVISAFRQNVAGVPDSTVRGADGRLPADVALDSLSTGVRAIVTVGASGARSAFRTLRNAISWDRGIPRALDLGAGGGGNAIGWGVVAALGALGLFLVGAKTGANAGARRERQRSPKRARYAGGLFRGHA